MGQVYFGLPMALQPCANFDIFRYTNQLKHCLRPKNGEENIEHWGNKG